MKRSKVALIFIGLFMIVFTVTLDIHIYKMLQIIDILELYVLAFLNVSTVIILYIIILYLISIKYNKDVHSNIKL